ncbi:hypothetical protein FO488_00305 [Geobacter sp. FeAm09]|uniref:hypothetical protein n=1 Tax=Geobacter sp. FeAm09 TaxID=2597769 RepID=UPI0011EE71E6|nr:hypothetical protein [Geobacter sp. FeAm09]QEM66748.1 hypothetical protein FO488_00305 [Geobacter sp. FeAm09]
MSSEQEQIHPAVFQPTYVTTTRMYLTVAAWCFFTTLAALVTYDRYFATKIVISDVPDKLVEIKKFAAAGQITPQQAAAVSEQEMQAATNLADSLPSNYIVIMGDAIIGSHKKNPAQ